MKLDQAKEKLLSDVGVRQAFQRKDIEDLKISIGLQILELRLLKDVTQKKLANMIGTKQPSIARAERGAILPSLAFLHKVAVSLGTELIYPKFLAVVEHEVVYRKTASFVGESSLPALSGIKTMINQERTPTREFPVRLVNSVLV